MVSAHYSNREQSMKIIFRDGWSRVYAKGSSVDFTDDHCAVICEKLSNGAYRVLDVLADCDEIAEIHAI
jgi:hypothetical protein